MSIGACEEKAAPKRPRRRQYREAEVTLGQRACLEKVGRRIDDARPSAQIDGDVQEGERGGEPGEEGDQNAIRDEQNAPSHGAAERHGDRRTESERSPRHGVRWRSEVAERGRHLRWMLQR